MNIEALNSRYKEGLPDSLKQLVEQFTNLSQRRGIKQVTLLSNFGKDVELSLKYDTIICKGVLIQAEPDYELSEADRIWLHPQLCKGRSLYGSASNKISESELLDNFSSSVGSYATHSIDEIGGYSQEEYTIVDTGIERDSNAMVDSWIIGKQTLKQAYQELQSSNLLNKTQKNRDAIAKSNGIAEQAKQTWNYNMLYSNVHTMHFYNHAIKPANGKVLVHISPLMGYSMVTGVESQSFVSDLMSCDEYVDVNELGEKAKVRAYVNCKWAGKDIVNTYTMRKPISFYKEFLESEKHTMYRMQSGYFSSNPIHAKLPPEIVLFLTPLASQMPAGVDCHEHLKRDVIALPLQTETINALMKNHWKDLISSKYINGNKLILPRQMIQQSLV